MNLSLSIWGDSIMRGVVFDPVKKKYEFLRNSAVELFSKTFSIPVRNHSRFGCTAPRAYLNLMKTLNTEGAPDLILLEFGGNDCDYNWKEVSKNPHAKHLPNTPLKQFEDTLKQMIQAVQKAGGKPVLMSLPPIQADRYFDFISSYDEVESSRILDFLQDKQLIYRHQELYSGIVCRLAGDMNVSLIDVRTRFLEQDRLSDFLCLDGIHPNEMGQRLINDAFAERYAAIGE